MKGKQIAGKDSPGKRKRPDSDKTGGKRARKKPGVIQFFDDVADVDEDVLESDEMDSSSEEDDELDDQDFTDEVETKLKGKEAFGKSHNLPFLPKEEELSDDELERLLEERYRSGSQYVKYAEDEFETKGFVDKDSPIPSRNGPIIWRVKCVVGRERQAAFCLIQKYVDLQSLGTKLKIVSAFALDHSKGYIYFEADKECDVHEACKGVCTIYSSKISQVPYNEVAQLFSVKNTSSKVSPGMWVRVKYGNYKRDLALVVAVDNARKKATIKLVPRIDLQALARKLAGGGTVKQTAVPPARVISPSELEEFRSHIQITKDRQTGRLFETINGLKLKDGYLFKTVLIDSLSYVDVMPSDDEVLKFKTSKKDPSDDVEWLSHLYGEQQKKRSAESEGTSGTKEGASRTKKVDGFKLHDLIFFGRNDFGVVIGAENDTFQVIKEDAVEGAEVVPVELHEIQNNSLDKKLTTLDKHMKAIYIKDTIRVLEGPFKGKQGAVRHICRGTVFIYDENQLENGGYFCAKSQLCEKIKTHLFKNIFQSKDINNATAKDNNNATIDNDVGHTDFEDSTSPQSSQFSKKPWQTRENTRDFSNRRQGDRDGAFSIGQSLRIRVGPLKGHLCRVVAIYRSDITVKLDSQLKTMIVKCEDLSEAGVKSSRVAESNFSKPYEGFGAQGLFGEGSGAPAENNGWNSASSSGRKLRPDFSGSDFMLDATASNPFESLNANDDSNKGNESDPWGSKQSSKKATDNWGKAVGSGQEPESSWGKPANANISGDKERQVDKWGGSADDWKTTNAGDGSRASTGWGTTNLPSTLEPGSSKDMGGSWDAGKLKFGDSSNDATDDAWGKKKNTDNSGSWDAVKSRVGDGSNDAVDAWGKSKNTDNNGGWDSGKLKIGDGSKNDETSAWGSQASKNDEPFAWDKGKGVVVVGNEGDCGKTIDSWGKAVDGSKTQDGSSGCQPDSWNKTSGTIGNQSGGWGNIEGSCMQPEAAPKDQESSWGKAEGGASGKSWNSNNANGSTDALNWRKSGSGADGGSWSKGTISITEGGWKSGKGFDSDGGPSWDKGRDGNVKSSSGRDQQDTWNRENFDGGRGSGGRRGRGGFRGGNRDHSSGGRSFGRGRSSNWNKEENQNEFNGDEHGKSSSGWKNSTGWKNEAKEASGSQSSGWNNGNNPNNWNNDKGNQASGWKQYVAANGEGGNWKNNSGEDKGSSWNTGTRDAGGKKSSGWDNGKNDSGEDGGSGWKSGTGGAGGNKSSSWGSKESWATAKDSSGSQSGGDMGSGWKSGTSDAGGNNWGNKNSWGTPKDSSNNQFGENSGSGWKSGSSDADVNKSSGWGNKNSWGASKDSFGSQSDWNQGNSANDGNNIANADGRDDFKSNNWNKGGFGNSDGGGDWRGGKSFGRGRGRSSGWNGDSSGEGTDFSNQTGGFGRGRSSGSNRGDFGSRGGFGNRGGDFRGRGRGRRDQSSGGWNRGENDSGNDWRSSSGSESWKQGGMGNKQNWNTGTGSTNGYGGSGWNNGASAAKETDGTSWKNGGGSANEAGGSGKQGWGGWNKPTSGNHETGGTSWKSGGGSGNETGGTGKQGWGGWNKPTGGNHETGGTSWKSGGGSGNETGGTGAQGWGGWNKSTSGSIETGESSWKTGGGQDKETGATGTQGWGSGDKLTSGNNETGGINWKSGGGPDKETGGTGAQGWGGWNKSAGGNNETRGTSSSVDAKEKGGSSEQAAVDTWGEAALIDAKEKGGSSEQASAGTWGKASSVDAKKTGGSSEQAAADTWGKAAAAPSTWEKKGW